MLLRLRRGSDGAGRRTATAAPPPARALQRTQTNFHIFLCSVGRLLGCVTYVPDRSSPWAELLNEGEAAIRMLAADPAGQGRGVGTRLLDACIQRATTHGRDGLFLHSTPWMEAAHRLYQRAGFQRVPDRDWLPVPDVPLLAFRLALPRLATR